MPDLPEDSKPSADRERSYDGGYMKVGRMGEDIAFGVLRTHPSVKTLEDLRGDLAYQAQGIDARIKLRSDERLVTVEIKTDQHLDVSGRWLFELYRVYLTVPIDNAHVVGWSIRSEAELLVFYAPAMRRLHFIKMKDYRVAHREAVACGKCQHSVVATDRIKRTLNAYFGKEFVEKMPSYRMLQLPEILNEENR